MSHQLLKNEIYPTPKKNEIDLLSNKKVEPQVFGPPKKLSPRNVGPQNSLTS